MIGGFAGDPCGTSMDDDDDDSSHATLLDHDDIMHIPFPFTVRRDLSQSAGGPWQLPLPPFGLSLGPKNKRERWK